MAKTQEEIYKILQEDLQKFSNQVDYYRHNKRKLIIPKHANQLIVSASLVAYLTERLKLFKEDE